MNKILNARCAYHPRNYIKSFCNIQSCLLPLCQQCEYIHREQHQYSGVHSKIQKIQQVYNNAIMQAEYYKNALNKFKQCITTLYKQKQKKVIYSQKEYKLKYKLEQVKKMIYFQLQRTFAQVQDSIEKHLYQSNQQFKYSIEGLSKSISQRGKVYQNIQQNLCGDNFLEYLIFMHSDSKRKQQSLFIKMGQQKIKVVNYYKQYLKSQQLFRFQPNVQFIQECITNLKAVLFQSKEKVNIYKANNYPVRENVELSPPMMLSPTPTPRVSPPKVNKYAVPQDYESPINQIINNQSILVQDCKEQKGYQNQYSSPLNSLILKRRKVRKGNSCQTLSYLPLKRSKIMRCQQQLQRPNLFNNKKYLQQ